MKAISAKRQAWFDGADFRPTAKLSFHDRMCLGSTGFATSVPWVIFGYFLTFFYTDVIGMPGALAGALILGARLFDAFTDILIGIAIDKFNLKWGKFRSWILFSIPLQIVLFIMVFTALPDTTSILQKVIAVIGYGCYGAIASTLVFIPMNCQFTNEARNQVERGVVTGYKGVWQNGGTILAVLTLLPLVALIGGSETSKIGWFVVAVIVAIITTAPTIWTYFRSERYELNADGTYREHLRDLKREAGEKVGLGELYKNLFKNRPAMITVIATFIMYLLQGVRSGTVVYLYRYYFNQPGLTSIGLFFNTGTAILGAIAIPYIIKMFKDTNRAFIVTILGSSGIYLIWYLIIIAMGREAAGNAMRLGGGLFILYALCGFLQGAHYAFPNVILPQAADFGHVKFGRSQMGFVFSFYGVCLTVGGAFGGSILGFFLGAIGYDPEAASSNPLILRHLLTVGVLIPIIIGVIQAVVQAFYGYNDKRHADDIKKIEQEAVKEKA
jgi:Na+/melibiose symporter-like transporter